jgi:hypothetical protein
MREVRPGQDQTRSLRKERNWVSEHFFWGGSISGEWQVKGLSSMRISASCGSCRKELPHTVSLRSLA